MSTLINPPTAMSRRQVLSGAAILGAGLLVAACGSDSGTATSATTGASGGSSSSTTAGGATMTSTTVKGAGASVNLKVAGLAASLEVLAVGTPTRRLSPPLVAESLVRFPQPLASSSPSPWASIKSTSMPGTLY